MNRKVILGAFVVAIAAVAGFGIQHLLADHPPITEDKNVAATVASVPAAAPSDEDAPHARPIPETVPAIALPDDHGVSRQLSEWKGRPVIINFWATWCGPCREEIPLLKALRNERTQDRLEVVGIAIDQREAVLKYVRDIGIDYPVLIGEKEGYAAAESFGVSLVLPFSVFADSQGRIVTLKIGELHANEAAFILDRVRDIDMKRLELTAARRQIVDKMREFAVDRGKEAATADGIAEAAADRG